MLPGFLGIIPQFLVLQWIGPGESGLIGTKAGLILLYVGTGVCGNTFSLRGHMAALPKELEEAAVIDGAGTLKIFFSIIVPVIKPIIATVAIFASVAQWNSFQDTLLLVTDPKLYTLQFTLYQYINQASSLKALVNSSSSAAAMAASLAHASTATSIRMTVSVIVVLPIICVYPVFQRYFTKGIMIGAVKG